MEKLEEMLKQLQMEGHTNLVAALRLLQDFGESNLHIPISAVASPSVKKKKIKMPDHGYDLLLILCKVAGYAYRQMLIILRDNPGELAALTPPAPLIESCGPLDVKIAAAGSIPIPVELLGPQNSAEVQAAAARITQPRIVQIMSHMALPIRGCIRLALKLPLKLLKLFTLPAAQLASLVSLHCCLFYRQNVLT